jgi:SAM-dependent methyltransferase
MDKPTTRFSSRVDRYVKYRPSYPREIYRYLISSAGLLPSAEIADLGSGTGILSKLFLDQGHKVFGIEPNDEMRQAGEEQLASERHFESLKGRAEDIPLDAGSVDFVTAGQAFHWFDPQETRAEAKRVLRPGGQVALIWNEWNRTLSPLLAGYEDLLIKFGSDYKEVSRKVGYQESLQAFFESNEPTVAFFSNYQLFDFPGLRGRLLSSSYVPLEGHADFDLMLQGLQRLFDQNQEAGQVKFDYRTSVYHAELDD